ncbi:MAG: AMP nucleosidase [Chlamydiae bacterium SM23_39]|nr:MAG: AMP nucleosidase [Chlamydiae bacterium SM23_39]
MENEKLKKKVALETLERYSGSKSSLFCSNLIITNFPKYVEYFADSRKISVFEGSMFKVAHCKDEDITILDFKIGSPAAALVIDICSFLPIKASIFLGMCGGLRRKYEIGQYLVPVASIRGEGTSDYYFPPEVPSLANFMMQRAVSELLEEENELYHVGITYTTNMRFWEFKEEFVNKLKLSKAQGIEMECATLFSSSYKNKFPLGALLLISDLPLDSETIKTKESSDNLYQRYMKDHVEKGVKILKLARVLLNKQKDID